MQNCILIGDRTEVVATVYGHSIGFRKGEPTDVPNIPAVLKACLDRGHKRLVVEEAAPEPVVEPEPEPETKPAAVVRGRPKKADA
jgi:hypothetical protein